MIENSACIREVMTEALAFWEPRRIAYNLLLLIITVVFLARDWQHGEVDVDFQLFMLLAAYLVFANLTFCAAYFIELLAARLDRRLQWQQWRGAGFYASLVITLALSCRFFVAIGSDFF